MIDRTRLRRVGAALAYLVAAAGLVACGENTTGGSASQGAAVVAPTATTATTDDSNVGSGRPDPEQDRSDASCDCE